MKMLFRPSYDSNHPTTKVYWPNVLPQESEKMFSKAGEKNQIFLEFAWEQLESYWNKCQQFSKESMRHHWSQKKTLVRSGETHK